MNWVMLYNDVLTELYGEDREDAMRHIEDDNAFDAWLKRYSAKQRTGNKSKGKSVSQEEYFARTKGSLPQPKPKNENGQTTA